MSKLIASTAILVGLAILVFLNVSYKTTINLFGAELENVSVVIIALAGFVLGIVYSVVLHIISRISRRRKASLKKTENSLTAKAAKLDEREKSVAAADDAVGATGFTAPDADVETTTMSAGRMDHEAGRPKPQRPRSR